MRSSGKNNPVVPRIFRKPMIPAAVLIALDILTLAAAAVLNALRGSIREEYRLYGGEITASEPYGWFGIAAAVLLVAAAAVTALIIAGSVLRGKARGAELAFEIGAAILLLAVSAAIAGFSAYIVRGERPINVSYVQFTDEQSQLIFAEEQYKRENLLKVYLAQSSKDGTLCEMAICVPLGELTQGSFEERYTIYTVAENTARIGFADGTSYRTIDINI